MREGGQDTVYEATAILGDVLARVADTDLAAPTPCTGWSVSQLLSHVVATLTKFSAFAEGQTDAPRTASGDMLVPDTATAFAAARARALAAWAVVDPSRRCVLPFGEFSGAQAAAIASFDVLLHAWDLAQAIGARVQAPSEHLRTVATSVAERLVTPDAIIGGYYAHPEPGPDVPGWGDLLGRTGRSLERPG